ncbi:hypothetical protein CA54_58510 [Symmachiella macrocystis]|uniref:Uncharacterized protein n=1 Tax=Symmachiella macrocystis TaxID=2527985 RepID=A0A5C6AYV9_9PLAN|nr:hypothetical protein [Symmachiella macrocystis]TWU05163.1 hypothetical protein CA54_58510 [Symmachiella macrocystis]
MRALTFQLSMIIALCGSVCGCGTAADETNQNGESTSQPVPEDHSHNEDHHGLHSHAHDHSKAQPLHGGELVEVGHTHNKDGARHYFAEVMPLHAGEVQFFLARESDHSGLEDYRPDTREIVALVDAVSEKRPTSKEIRFAAEDIDGQPLKFSANLNDVYPDAEELMIVIPKLKVGQERMNFSFSITRQGTDSESEHEHHQQDEK